MKYGFKNNIRVLYGNGESDPSIFSRVKNSIAQKGSELVNDAGALMFIESKLIQANSRAAVDKIVAENKGELTPKQIETIYILFEFGEIGINMVGKDTVRGGKKFFALKEVLKKSTKEPHIMTFANGEYTVHSISAYKSQIANNPEAINIGVVKGFMNLSEKNNSLSFENSTWEDIATYCAKREWKTKIIGEDRTIGTFLGTKYGEKIKKEEGTYEGILKEFIGKLDDANLRSLLTQNKLEKTPNGKIDIGKIIMRLDIQNPTQVPKLLKTESEKLRKDGQELLNRAREEQKTLSDLRDLKSLNIPNIPSTIERKAFASFTRDECIKYIPIIDELLKKEQNPIKKREIEKIKGILIKTKEGYERIKDSGSINAQEKITESFIKKNPNASLESVIINSETIEARQKESLSGEATLARATIEQGNNILKDMGVEISSFEEIQKQYNYLLKKEKTTGLTIDEQRIKTQLYSQIQANIRAAQVVKNYEGLLTKEDIETVFTDANKFISNNPNEKINFQALEKIATLTDPESTPGQKLLAKLESGQSLSMSKALEGEMTTPITNAPELNQVNISKNQDGTYNIPLFDAKGISKEQVEEYKESTKLYAELGLSQFIPHIPLINTELRKDGINATIDGQVSTIEQQKILKALYSKVFGKEIISSNLGEVERAFSSALGNPTNMKNAMQNVLIKHKLISGTAQPIRADNLKNFISSQEKSSDPTTDFHFI